MKKNATKRPPLSLLGGLLALAALPAGASPLAAKRHITALTISGTVYDDVNYGGGAGRPYATANTSAQASGLASAAIGRSGATVELYDASGTFVTSTTTGTGGTYSFGATTTLGVGSYTVRVVNATVTPARGSSATGLLPVQTYVNGNTARVGGENAQATDAAAGTTGTTLAGLSTGTGTAAVTPESITTVSLASLTSVLTGVDFGFNFDTVVNTRNAGQGSLSQFITNANALANASLDQAAASTGGSDPAAGVETSIFMIADGQAHDGLAAGLANQLSSAGVAVLTLTSALPQLTGTNSPYTSLDGTTQTQNVGNTNNVTLGTGGTVGTAATALAQLNGPEVQLTGNTGIAYGLNVGAAATYTTIRGLAILDFGNARDSNAAGNVASAANNLTLTQNVLGATATSFSQPATITNADNVRLMTGTTGIVVSNNLIGFSNSKGVTISSGVTNVSISGNEIRGNGLTTQTTAKFDAIDAQGSGTTIVGNLLTDTSGQGIDSYRTAGSLTITDNTITGNGRGLAGLAPGETPGVRLYGAGSVVRRNIISDNYGAGIMLIGLTNNGNTAAVSTTTISQNSIFNNGNVAAKNSTNTFSGQIGIDLQANGDGEASGTSPYVTLNSSTTTGANGLLNYPILTSAVVSGGNLVLGGYAKATATVELFVAQNNPASVNATGTYFGQGETYLLSLVENGSADSNPAVNQSYSGTINGVNQGTDSGTASAFTFTVALTAAQQALLGAGTLLTSTATLSSATSEFSGNVRVQQPPVPNDAANTASISNQNTSAVALSPSLSATANGQTTDLTSSTANAIASYVVSPATTGGTLYYNGTAVTAATTVPVANLSLLKFLPTSGFTGTATFTYTALDANGLASSTHNASGTSSSGAATYRITVTSAPLPVTLVSFTAEATAGGAQLAWTTASELNNAYFVVERSLDGSAFVALGQVAGHGSTATAHAYAYLDATASASAQRYYRLRQVDLDGTSTYSPVRVLWLAAPAGLTLYPNPTTDTAVLGGAGAGTRVVVLDAMGRVVATATAAADGTAALPAGLAPGLYVVRGGSQTIRLVVN